jgi:hypothetical protein
MEPGVLGSVFPPSEESETDWNDDMEETCACPGLLRDASERLSLDGGGYVCSTVSESDRLGAGRDVELALQAPDDLDASDVDSNEL